ncbi:MAG: exonuclease subunit SbcD [Spirulinaceae cyanobacterium SM2_1_0]|nr:exonuclease subunit SbcD [Spirulinaceae cyanobacterium SM2_1_0]
MTHPTSQRLKILHLSDIHLGSGFNHGHIDPETRRNTRLGDFLRSLSACIDRAIAEPVDLVLFGGDAFPDATPPPYVQEAFAQQFHRLAAAQIPTVLLVGNHDQHSQGEVASLCIYRTLAVPGFVVGDRLATHRIHTNNSPVQIVTLPWLTPSSLLERPETEQLSVVEVRELLLQRLQVALEGEIRQLDPDVPTVLLAHVMADRAQLGAERFLAVGKGFTIPSELLARPEFDYVALGHVHKHQNLNPSNDPPIVYPGSIERVDFSEEKEAKGYVLIELAKQQVAWEFCPLATRPFHTIRVDVTQSEEPQAALLAAIAKTPINDAVVRLLYTLRTDQLDAIDPAALHTALSPAHNYAMRAELASQMRSRLPELGAGSQLAPLEALELYLNEKSDLKDLRTDMLTAAQQLLNGESIEFSLDHADTGKKNTGKQKRAREAATEYAATEKKVVPIHGAQLRLL